MRVTRIVSMAALLLTVASCRHPNTTVGLHSPKEANPPLLAKAKLATEVDLPTLVQAGGTILGELNSENALLGSASEMIEDARTEAAEAGGTHIVLTTEGPLGSRPAPTYAEISRRFAKWLIVRVPTEQWRNLPVELYPYSYH
jgi:hypothetical protein